MAKTKFLFLTCMLELIFYKKNGIIIIDDTAT